jgi:hypothetical protein
VDGSIKEGIAGYGNAHRRRFRWPLLLESS